MHNLLCDASSRHFGLRGGWMLPLTAVMLLSFGVGATTAAFTLLNGTRPQSAAFYSCETMLQISGDPPPSSSLSANIPSSVELQERVADAYETRYQAAGDAASSWSDVMNGVDTWPVAPLVAAAALALLVACARAAAQLVPAPGGTTMVAGSAIGSLVVAAMLITVFGLPALGIRAVAFAISVSLIAARVAFSAKNNVPAIA